MNCFIVNEDSFLITWNEELGSELTQKISFFKKEVENHLGVFIIECVQSINSVLIKVDINEIKLNQALKEIKNIKIKPIDYLNKKNKIWEIPVCYDENFGFDLQNLSNSLSISKNKIIELHKSKVYDLLSMGFLPGFLYLGLTDNKLYCERKNNPSLNISKGSIGLALNQTCIYPRKSPGGWNIIGNSPINFFDINSKNPCFATPGDKIKFYEISFSEHQNIKSKPKIPTYKIS